MAEDRNYFMTDRTTGKRGVAATLRDGRGSQHQRDRAHRADRPGSGHSPGMAEDRNIGNGGRGPMTRSEGRLASGMAEDRNMIARHTAYGLPSVAAIHRMAEDRNYRSESAAETEQGARRLPRVDDGAHRGVGEHCGRAGHVGLGGGQPGAFGQ
jgi:hypothetical protein